MGFVRAFRGAFGGTLGDQWVDFYAPKDNLSVTAAVFQEQPGELTRIEEPI